MHEAQFYQATRSAVVLMTWAATRHGMSDVMLVLSKPTSQCYYVNHGLRVILAYRICVGRLGTGLQ